MKLAGIGSVLLAWAAWGLAPGPSGQSAVDLEATVDVTSVRVGEPFTVRLVVAQERTGEVRFPALMNVPESLEQTGPVRIRSGDEGRRWEAEYTLVAWRAEPLAIPPVEVELASAGGVIRSLQPPAVPVLSVLPEADDPLELREARPFLGLRGFPWWLLALAAALAWLAWWTWGRRRVAPSAAEGPAQPADIALRELERLRKVWIERRVTGDRLYDGYEATLRRYARSTRGWKPSRELLGLGDQDSGLVAALRHSVLARFARLRTDRDGPLGDLDVGEAFVRSEMPVGPRSESEEVTE